MSRGFNYFLKKNAQWSFSYDQFAFFPTLHTAKCQLVPIVMAQRLY